ncbi:dihydroxy-acid dehydratase [Candidatus Palauibacter sp.]|uniref:dihydroxy-acid dehydratase n=1 Tax=Candidatus Palauibacter sp. TaxID=3101350 RepID=UPI003CC55932
MLNRISSELTQHTDRPAARAMLFAAGLTEDDLDRAQIGIVSSGYEGNPCNMHLNDLAVAAREGVRSSGMIGFVSNTIGVSDGISMGTLGMRYSLPSRDLIADSIETIASAQHYDGLITVMGCDKNMPGAMMGMSRLNRPALMVYGGTIAPGHRNGDRLDVVSSFEALGQRLAGTITEEKYREIVRSSCPGAGACGGMFTANTMASAIEVMGMSLPGSSSNPATSDDKTAESRRAGEAIRVLLERNLRPRDILTREAFENAITLSVVIGGSTNVVLHLLAMARTLQVDLTIDDFQRISDRTPLLADFRPSGPYVMEDLHRIGGMPALIRVLLAEGLLRGDCMTVTGKTLAENAAEAPPLADDPKVIHGLADPIKASGHLRILYGNVAEGGAVAKITGKEGEVFEGPARVFDSEADANRAIGEGRIRKGDVIVIRYEGPRGGPGMPEMLTPTSMIMGRGLGGDIALITDGRFSGGTHGFVVGHITPEAQDGGLLALLADGDRIRIDAIGNTINVHLSPAEIQARREEWTAPPLRANSGALYRYARTVSPASEGCTTDRDAPR